MEIKDLTDKVKQLLNRQSKPWNLSYNQYENKRKFLFSIFEKMKKEGVSIYSEGELNIIMDSATKDKTEEIMRGFKD